jgi:hypothetical protein
MFLLKVMKRYYAQLVEKSKGMFGPPIRVSALADVWAYNEGRSIERNEKARLIIPGSDR